MIAARHLLPQAILCATALALQPALAAQDDSLYRDLGETVGLQAITDDLIAALHHDPRTEQYFVDADDRRIRSKLVEQLCQLSGGPCDYTGRSMQRAHEGMHITRAAFNAMVEDLEVVMEHHDIPNRVQNRLLARLAPMVHDVEDR